MAVKKKLHYTLIQVHVISNEPLDDKPDFVQIVKDLTDDYETWDIAGNIVIKKRKEIQGRVAAKMVLSYGYDPEMFDMNQYGNET